MKLGKLFSDHNRKIKEFYTYLELRDIGPLSSFDAGWEQFCVRIYQLSFSPFGIAIWIKSINFPNLLTPPRTLSFQIMKCNHLTSVELRSRTFWRSEFWLWECKSDTKTSNHHITIISTCDGFWSGHHHFHGVIYTMSPKKLPNTYYHFY